MPSANGTPRPGGCPDLDSRWPDILGEPRGPTLCVSYPRCRCGDEDERAARSQAARPPATRRPVRPGTRRSPRHERMALVVEIQALGDDRRFVSHSDYHFPVPADEAILADVPVHVEDQDTGPRTQVLYLAMPPRLPARKT